MIPFAEPQLRKLALFDAKLALMPARSACQSTRTAQVAIIARCVAEAWVRDSACELSKACPQCGLMLEPAETHSATLEPARYGRMNAASMGEFRNRNRSKTLQRLPFRARTSGPGHPAS